MISVANDPIGHLLDTFHLPELHGIGCETCSATDPLSHINAMADTTLNTTDYVYTNAQQAADRARGLVIDPVTGSYSGPVGTLAQSGGPSIGVGNVPIVGPVLSLFAGGIDDSMKGAIWFGGLVLLGVVLVLLGAYVVTRD